ncbi:MAG: carboxypeptidase-like regulatory domain-containing protein, partial [bacterium]
MSITRKIFISVIVTVLVLGAGYYLSQPNQGSRSSTQKSSEFQTPEGFAQRWDISPFSNVTEDDTSTGLPSDVTQNDLSDTRFKLTGQVSFPQNVEGETVTVKVEIKHLNLPREKLLGLRRNLYKLDTSGDDSQRAALYGLRKAIGGRSFTDLPTEIRTVQTDRSGQFSLSDVPVGVYSAKIVSPTRWSGSTDRLTVLIPGLQTRMTLDALRTPTVTGRVTTPEGEPIKNVTVYEAGDGLSTKTNSSGKYTLRGLDVGQEESLTIGKKGFMKRELTIEPLENGEVRNRDITLRSGVDVTVKVRYPDGQPVRKGMVTFVRADTATRTEDGYLGLRDNKGTHFQHNLKEPLNEQGIATFTSRHPGRVRVSYSPVRGANKGTMKLVSAMGGMKTLNISSGKANEVTLQAYRGEKFDLRIVNRQTGEELTDWQLITMKTFDKAGNPVKGFYRHESNDITGLIRDNVERMKA